MISIVYELNLKGAKNLPGKVKGHLKRNWPLYLMGAGAVGSGVVGGRVADELDKAEYTRPASAIRAVRAPALVGTGFAIAKSADRLNRENGIMDKLSRKRGKKEQT